MISIVIINNDVMNNIYTKIQDVLNASLTNNLDTKKLHKRQIFYVHH